MALPQQLASHIADEMAMNYLPVQFTASTMVVWVIDMLKRANWFPWMTADTGAINRAAAVIGAAATAVGIHMTLEPSTTVAGTYESNILEQLGVVVAGDGNNGGFRTGPARANVDHVLEALWRARVEFVKLRLQTDFFQFSDDVIARLDNCLAACRPRPKSNYGLQINTGTLFTEGRIFRCGTSLESKSNRGDR